MTNWEDELQQNIESGQPVDNGPDAQAYRAVFEAIQKEPEYVLPPGFARRVMQNIEIREKRWLSVREVRAVALAVFLMIAALAVTIYMTGVKPALGILNQVQPYWGFILFAISFVALLNWLDRKFIIRRPSV
jgi:sterol desaturase/sphingolipid hydroxylase (fatty acid hydroxylase superfamily)